MFLQGRRPTWAESDLRAIISNIKAVRKIVGREVKYLLPVKANAYGHGMISVAKEASASGVEFLGVATIDEALTLRQAGITSPILILGLSFVDQIPAIVKNNITATVATKEFVNALNREALKQNKRATVHLKVDTGMGRIGVRYKDALDMCRFIAGKKNIFFEGIFTHFPVSDEDLDFSYFQLDRFDEVLDALRDSGICPPIIHSANSAASIRIPRSRYNMIRPGLISYGYYPCEDIRSLIKLRPAISLKSKIVFVKEIEKGQSVSYGRTFIAKKKSLIATLPIGYEDGLNRKFSNNMEVLIRGKRVPLVGRITMDQCMIDVSGIGDVKIGEEVVIIGKQKDGFVSVEELAKRINTISYEITCMIASRVPLFCKIGKRQIEEKK